MHEHTQQLKAVSDRLVWSLGALVAIAIPGGLYAFYGHHTVPTPLAVLFAGFVGGFVGIQRRLKELSEQDLSLMANSWVCILLSPVAGAILAEILFLLFVSGLLSGALFPNFKPDFPNGPGHELKTLFEVHCDTPADYAKIIFWSFVAGFSEKFVTNIMGALESRADGKPDPDDPPAPPATAQ
jgi:hypothetical protein